MKSQLEDEEYLKVGSNHDRKKEYIPELIRFKLSLAACACFCPLDCVSSVIISPTAVEDACKPPIKREEGKKCQRFCFCLSRCFFFFFFLTIIGKVEIDKKTRGRGKREEGKRRLASLSF